MDCFGFFYSYIQIIHPNCIIYCDFAWHSTKTIKTQELGKLLDLILIISAIFHRKIENIKNTNKMHHYLLQGEQEVAQQLELSVKCFDLIQEAKGLGLDSFLVVKLIERNKPIKQLVKSKIYWSCANPDYEEKFKLQFCFKYEQKLLLEIFENDTKPTLYGWVEATVSKIFGCRGGSPFETNIKVSYNKNDAFQKHSTARMQISCKKKQRSEEELLCMKIKVNCYDIEPLRKLIFFSEKSPYFFTISKTSKSTETIVYRSEQMKNFAHGEFREFDVRKKIFQENYSEFQLKVYQGDHVHDKEIGRFTFAPLDLELKKSQKFVIKKDHKPAGFVTIELIEQFNKYTFADYLDAGLEFKLVCNLDFTASNKKITDPESLHRISGGGISTYEKATSEAMKILLDYDNDKLIPTYGFGAKVSMPNYNSQGKVSHCFPLNGDINNPNLYQIQGILKAYRSALQYLDFAGPTKFYQILQNAINHCKATLSDQSQYVIAFILTDGQMHDMQDVIDLIDKNSYLPLSIIILGIGLNDFSQMIKLDGDDQPLLNSKGKRVRDIVQFVNYEKCMQERSKLTVSILEELPAQVLDFYANNKLTPERIADIANNKQKSKKDTIAESSRKFRSEDPHKGSKVPKASSKVLHDSTNFRESINMRDSY